MNEPTSVVIVQWPKGFVAHVRFADARFDRDMSNTLKHYLYYDIEKYVQEINP